MQHPESIRIGRLDRPAWLMSIGLGIVAMVSLGFESAPRSEDDAPRLGEDMVLALPVPDGSQVLARSIDHARRRSLLVVDLDPTDPPNSRDIAVFLRLEPVSGVLLARSASPDWLPDPGPSVNWWIFPHRSEVRVSSHPTMQEAVASLEVSVWSGNPDVGPEGARVVRVLDRIRDAESNGSPPVGIDIDR